MRALWSDRPNCSHNVSQKVKRIRRFSDLRGLLQRHPNGTETNGHQNADFQIQKILAFLKPIRFDTLLRSVKETDTQTGTKTNGYRNAPF